MDLLVSQAPKRSQSASKSAGSAQSGNGVPPFLAVDTQNNQNERSTIASEAIRTDTLIEKVGTHMVTLTCEIN